MQVGLRLPPLSLSLARNSRETRLRRIGLDPWATKEVDEVKRIKHEAVELFGDEEGTLDLKALANAPRTAREEKALRHKRLLEELNLI